MRKFLSLICLTLFISMMNLTPLVHAADNSTYTDPDFHYRITIPKGLVFAHPSPTKTDMFAINADLDAFMFSLGLLTWTKRIDLNKLDWSVLDSQVNMAMEKLSGKIPVEIVEKKAVMGEKEKLPHLELLIKIKNPKNPLEEFSLLSYFVLADHKLVWVAYAAPGENFEKMLPAFRKSFASYKNLPTPKPANSKYTLKEAS